MTTKQTTPKTARKRQNTQNASKPRKPRKPRPVIKETLEDISFLAPEPAQKKLRKSKSVPVAAKALEKKGALPAKRVPFQKDDLPVLSQKKEQVPFLTGDFQPQNFEFYCLHHWGKVNLYFLLPASISPPLLGLWLTPAGMTAGFAILVFIAVLGIANCLTLLLVLLFWALKGNR